MIQIHNLTPIQNAFCEILWAIDDISEVKAFLSGVPDHLVHDAFTMFNMLQLEAIDEIVEYEEDCELAISLLNDLLGCVD